MDGIVAIITGGASGIGAAVAKRYVNEGAKVCIFDRDVTKAAALIETHTPFIIGVEGDVRSMTDNKAAVDGTIDAFGKLDIFIGNAGIYDFGRPLHDYTDDEIGKACDEMLAVNVKGYLLGVHAALPHLRKSDTPSVILTCSNAGLYAGGGGPLYTASKHAVVGLARQLAYDLAPKIRVNAVAPGGTITGLSGLEAVGADKQSLDTISGAKKHIESGVPLKIAPPPDMHANFYVLLGSAAESGATTGAILPSDGGLEVRGNVYRERG